MTPLLMFMRHAKSSWAEAGLSDHDRSLNDRGRRDAPRMADWLQSHRFLPELILCSSARRTRETVDLMCRQWTRVVPVEYRSDLYHASAGQFWTSATESLDQCRRVLVVGHNPGMQQLLSKFNRDLDHFPTSGVAILSPIESRPTSPNDESQTHYSDWKILEFMAPKQLPEN